MGGWQYKSAKWKSVELAEEKQVAGQSVSWGWRDVLPGPGVAEGTEVKQAPEGPCEDHTRVSGGHL